MAVTLRLTSGFPGSTPNLLTYQLSTQTTTSSPDRLSHSLVQASFPPLRQSRLSHRHQATGPQNLALTPGDLTSRQQLLYRASVWQSQHNQLAVQAVHLDGDAAVPLSVGTTCPGLGCHHIQGPACTPVDPHRQCHLDDGQGPELSSHQPVPQDGKPVHWSAHHQVQTYQVGVPGKAVHSSGDSDPFCRNYDTTQKLKKICRNSDS